MSSAVRPRPACRRPRRPVCVAPTPLLGLLFLVCLAAAVAGPPPAAAQGGEETPKASRPTPSASTAPDVHLDQLLKLPSGESYTIEKRGGLSRGEWEQTFKALRDQLAAEKKALAAAQAKMDKVARGANPWKVGPSIPGMPNTGDAPLDYQLQRAIEARRQRVHGLEEQLRQLNIKADLAGVPEDWRP